MAKYEREEFYRLSKAQLLDYIEQQIDQLNRFETRFRDVVRAYKGVLKEKEALESTLKALSLQQENVAEEGCVTEEEGVTEEADVTEEEGKEEIKGDVSEADREGRDRETEERGNEEVQPNDGSDASEAMRERNEKEISSNSQHLSPSPRPLNPSPVNVIQLKQQISTLTVAMATLTEEKSKMEANFQKDKKTMLSQQDSLTKQLQMEKEAAKKELTRCQGQLEAVQEALKSEQVSRMEEQRTHGEMLKELQNLITAEREHAETLQQEVHDKETEMEKLQKQIARDRTREYEENLKIMSVELEQVRSRLMVAEKQSQQPPPLLLQLQEDMERMKEEHVKSIEAEQRRANDAESRLRGQAEHEELRVANLEMKLSELSKTVGSYDQQREADQQAILKLKERISQLDTENTALTKAQMEKQANEVSSQVNEKLARMKALLKQATIKINEKAVLPSNVEELTVSDYNEILSSEPSRKEYELELYQLKDEFEKYKMRAQSVLRSKVNKMDSEVTNEEMKKLSNQNTALQENLLACQSSLEEEEEKHLLMTKKLREEMRNLHDKYKQQMTALDNANKLKLQELHVQMQATRERSLKLISEKDSEIQYLRSELQGSGSLPSTPNLQHKNLVSGSFSSISEETLPQSSTQLYSQENSMEFSGEQPNNDTSAASNLHLPLKSSSSDTTLAVKELLDQSSPVRPVGGAMGVASEMRLLHYVQEQQRRKEEAVIARKKIFELEDTIRELQEREQRQMEQTVFLKEEIRKLQRDRSRETENLEYLKNIIIHYMSADSAGREQMISPIATVLHFSRDEVAQIKRSIAARRWLTPKK